MRSCSILVSLGKGLLMVAALVHAGAAAADTLTFQEGDGGLYSATAATRIDLASPANHGSEPTIYASSISGVTTVSFVRFSDIIGNNVGQIPPASFVSSAVLELTRYAGSNVVTTVHQVYTAWDEYTVTGTNWPDVAGTDYSASVGTIPTGIGGTVSVDITWAVQTWALTLPNRGVLLRPAALGTYLFAYFYSDDMIDPVMRPRLTVEFTPPAPVTVTPTTWGRIKSLYQ